MPRSTHPDTLARAFYERTIQQFPKVIDMPPFRSGQFQVFFVSQSGKEEIGGFAAYWQDAVPFLVALTDPKADRAETYGNYIVVDAATNEEISIPSL